MEIVTVVLMVLIAPICIKMIDKSYRYFKRTELFKDLVIEED